MAMSEMNQAEEKLKQENNNKENQEGQSRQEHESVEAAEESQEVSEETTENESEIQEEEISEENVESLSFERLKNLFTSKSEKIKKLEEQLEELKDSNLRKAAELQNVRKRMQRERSQLYETAKINALEDFLPINDDLQRTLNAAEGLEIDDKFLDGVKMVAQKFDEVLKKLGVERIDQTMVPFDVDLHDAMMSQPAQDGDVESDMVLQVIENGYKMGDRTIRHAKVIVSE